MSVAPSSHADELERFGRYVVIRPIPKGGMAQLAQAFDTVAAVPVVLKRLPPKSEARRDRFLDEIKLSRSIAPHPNLVRTLDAGEIDGREFLAIEWIDGPDLERLLEVAVGGKLDLPVPVPVAASIIWQALRGLGHLHASGCIHRDVSAANIMVGYDGVARLIDYGIAKFEGKRHRTALGDGPVGTHGFTAPEQEEKNAATERSDIYSVGASLWFLLTGLRFYDHGVDNNGKEVLGLQLKERGRADVPPSLLTFLWRCLHRSPSVRYESADEAARAIEQSCPELAQPAQIAEFVGMLFAGEKKLAAERLSEWKRKYGPSSSAPATPAQTTAVMRRVEEVQPKKEPAPDGRSTMVIDWNAPRSQTTILVWCLLAALAVAGALVVVIKLAAKRHATQTTPIASTPPPSAPMVVPPPPSPPAVVTAPAPVEPAPVEPSVSPTPATPAAPGGLSAGAIRKRLAEARDLAGVGRSKIAREIYAELEQDPRARPQALLGLARLAQNEGDYAAAIRLSTDAAKAGAGPEALMVRGGAYLARHEPDRAKADFDRVLKLQPKNLDAAEGLKAAAQLKRDTP